MNKVMLSGSAMAAAATVGIGTVAAAATATVVGIAGNGIVGGIASEAATWTNSLITGALELGVEASSACGEGLDFLKTNFTRLKSTHFVYYQRT